jgi:plastocyanin
MQRWRWTSLTILTAVVAAAAGCGGSGGGGYNTAPGGNNPPNSANTNAISIGTEQTFNPSITTVPKGTTVTWTWNSCSDGGYGGYATCVKHNVTFDDGSNISSAVQDSGSFARTFTASGTFKYHCAIHGASMSGQVIVN